MKYSNYLHVYSTFFAMSVGVFTLILFIGAISAGLVGSLTGLGGGIIIIPLLTLGFGVDMPYAIGAALISVIATSSGSAITFMKERITNVRIGLVLEIATTIGAIIGALLSALIPANAIAVLFGLLLIFSSFSSLLRRKNDSLGVENIGQDISPLAHRLRLNSYYPTPSRKVAYKVKNIIGGFLMMLFAGAMSGLLGIGSGALKVVAMDKIMKMPFKVSTATSTFMIGVTALASIVIYLQKGYIVPHIATPVMVGVLLGASVGSRLVKHLNTIALKRIFTVIISIIAIQMIGKGISGQF